MKESKTTYSYMIEHMEDPSFPKVRRLACDFIGKLPQDLCDELYASLNRGVCALDSEPLLQMYFYAYGDMHIAKLNYAFNHLQKYVVESPEIEIIDYGCGQGLATMCYHDFIKEMNPRQKVVKITLIEPSDVAMSRAELLCSKFFPEAQLVSIQKDFESLNSSDIMTSQQIPTLQLFSNVLDVVSYDIEVFAQLVKDISYGDCEYVIVSPMISGRQRVRLMTFYEILDNYLYFRKVLDKGELRKDKEWTCTVLLCSTMNEKSGLTFDVEEVYNEASLLTRKREKNSDRCLKVFQQLHEGALVDDMRCQNALGVFYKKGIGIEQDYDKAFYWYTKSANKGFLPAITNLANCYYRGIGTKIDYEKAVRLLQTAFDSGYIPSYSGLAMCYMNGNGVKMNKAKAISLLKDASKENDKISHRILGECYQNGIGVSVDIPVAIQYYTKAGMLEDKKAIIALIDLFEDTNNKVFYRNEQFDVFVKAVSMGMLDVEKITITWSNREPNGIKDGTVLYDPNGSRLIKTLPNYE